MACHDTRGAVEICTKSCLQLLLETRPRGKIQCTTRVEQRRRGFIHFFSYYASKVAGSFSFLSRKVSNDTYEFYTLAEGSQKRREEKGKFEENEIG